MICWLPVLVLVFWHMQIVSNYVRQLQLQDNSRIHRVRLPAMLLCLNTQVMDQSASYEELLAAAATLGVCDSRQYKEWTLCPSCHPQVSEELLWSPSWESCHSQTKWAKTWIVCGTLFWIKAMFALFFQLLSVRVWSVWVCLVWSLPVVDGDRSILSSGLCFFHAYRLVICRNTTLMWSIGNHSAGSLSQKSDLRKQI